MEYCRFFLFCHCKMETIQQNLGNIIYSAVFFGFYIEGRGKIIKLSLDITKITFYIFFQRLLWRMSNLNILKMIIKYFCYVIVSLKSLRFCSIEQTFTYKDSIKYFAFNCVIYFYIFLKQNRIFIILLTLSFGKSIQV